MTKSLHMKKSIKDFLNEFLLYYNMATDQNSDLYCQACGKDVSRGKITISSTGRIYCPGLNGTREFPSCFEVENLVLMPRGQIPRSTTPSYICRPADEIREMIAKNTVTQFGPLEESLNPLKKEWQPLEVTAYECQTCEHLEKDLEKATAHAEIPLKSLPQGLIYSTVPGEQYEILVSASSVDHRHVSHHQIDQIQVLNTLINCTEKLAPFNSSAFPPSINPTNPPLP